MKFAAFRVTLSCADHGWHHRMPDHENMTIPRTDMTVASLLERVVALEDAIEPFARIAGWFDHQRPMHSVITTGNGDITVDDLLAARAVLATGVVLPLSLKWSNELPLHLRPINLIEKYPRIVNFIALEWNNPTAVCKYLDDLLIDHHGSRNGFPDEVRHELRILDDYCHRRPSQQSDQRAEDSAR